uniref:Eosinophil peroxidase n=1 Tax=Neogobius melanostomus TaxID=47308 RepID=A0A8C6WKK5_9GOBI
MFSMLLMTFGQWTTHDVTLTPITPITHSYNSSTHCVQTCARTAPCFPIEIPHGDPRLSRGKCMPFVRSSTACTGGQVRQQINAITAFLDMGPVYGADHMKVMQMRDIDSNKGLLKVNKEYDDKGRELMHFGPMTNNVCATRRHMTGDANAKEVPCFVGGDVRSNENIALTALHTLMLREHNRLARKLSNLNPHWDGERLYQEARKILGGMSQVITYRDYLGFIVGPDAMAKRLSVYPGYDSEVNPGISNVFATAALRFGHLTIQPYVFRLDKNYEEHPDYPSPLLHKAFFAPWRVVFEGGVDPILRGLIGRPAKLNTQEHMAPDEIREKLFKFSEDLALDLASLNMQRGRDHGLPGYNAWRKFCGLSQPSNMYELGKVLRNYQMAQRLMMLYKTPDNIDVWLGVWPSPLWPGAEWGRCSPASSPTSSGGFNRATDCGGRTTVCSQSVRKGHCGTSPLRGSFVTTPASRRSRSSPSGSAHGAPATAPVRISRRWTCP